MKKIAILGLGEAGPVFGKALKDSGMQVYTYDKLQDSSHREQQLEKAHGLGIEPADSAAMAIKNADLIISTVTASEAVEAAEMASGGINKHTHWLDLNSVSPATKAEIANIVQQKGGSFTEGVAMDTVPAKGLQVPILLCGPYARQIGDQLNLIGFNCSAISDEYGTASSTKLFRSVIIKGMESLFAESMEAASNRGVHREVIASLQATYPGLDWEELAGYQLSRACKHAQRRAAEMREAGKVVRGSGVNPVMSEAIAAKQQELADRQLHRFQHGLEVDDFVKSLATEREQH